MSEGYKIVYTGGSGEIEEKKSRFIANVLAVESEEEAVAFIAAMKKKYWDARHNCSAFIIGKNNELTRCSDDGEPGGTAGRPMLDVLLREEIHNVVVVVTRYFGGTLLGTGGLVRAYQKAVKAGLSDSVIVEKCLGQKLLVETDYNGIGKIQYILAQEEITILDTEYTERVLLKCMVPNEKKQKVEKDITEGTSGKAHIIWDEQATYAILQNKLIIF